MQIDLQLLKYTPQVSDGAQTDFECSSVCSNYTGELCWHDFEHYGRQI